MKCIKAGRSASLQGGLATTFVGISGVIWTVGAAMLGASPFFVIFGIFFMLFSVVRTGFSFYYTATEDRCETLEPTEHLDEPDLLHAYFGKGGEGHVPDEVIGKNEKPAGFCPYCGAKAQHDYVYCAHCGKELSKKQ